LSWADCKNGYDCVDGKCVETSENNDNSGGDTQSDDENSNTDDKGNNGYPDENQENPDEEYIFEGDNEAPLVSITSPEEDERISGTYTLSATASDPNGNKDVMHVAFFAGETLICKTGRFPPYSCSWNTLDYDEGRIELKAIVTDQAGLTGEDTVNPIVDNVDDPPVVEFISPKPGSMVMGKFKLNLDLYDDRGLKEVNFYVDGDLRETLSSEPWDIMWDTRDETLSSHTLKITAKDDKNQASEAEIIVTKIQGVLTVTSNKWINVIDLKTGSEVKSWQEDDKCYATMPVPDTSYFFFACGTAGIKMYDLSDAKSPVLKGSFNTAEFIAGNMYLTKDKKYLIVNSGNKLVTIKINDLEKGTMSLAAKLDTYVHSTCDKGRIYTYEKEDSVYLVIPAWDAGIKLFDVTDPENIIETGGWDLPGTTEHICNIAVVDNYVYAGEYDTISQGLHTKPVFIVNISDVYDVVLKKTLVNWFPWNGSNGGNFVHAMVGFENFLFTAINMEGGWGGYRNLTFSILNIENSEQPVINWSAPSDTGFRELFSLGNGYKMENAGLLLVGEESEEKTIVYGQYNSDDIVFIDVTNQNDPTLWKYIITDKGWTNDVLVVK